MKIHLPIQEIFRLRPATLALITSLCALALSSSTFALNTKTTHDATDIATGDMNGDGFADMVTCGTANGSSSINVLLGQGDGTFQKAKATAVGSGPVALVLGDFNRDGRLDVVTADAGTESSPGKSISVLLGKGDGTFQPRLKFSVRATPNSIAAADLDGDGVLDLVVGESSRFVVLLGDGAGGFQLTSTIRTSDFSTGIALGDADGDGNIDVLMGNPQTAPTLSRGNGDGTFRPAAATNANPVIHPVLIDLTGDNLPELVGLLVSAPNNLEIFVNLGNAVFQFTADVAGLNTFDDFVAGDFNHDGKIDLVFAEQTFQAGSPDFPFTVLGRGDGTFDVLAGGHGVDIGNVIAAGLFNADGELDLASGDSTAPVARTIYGLGDGNFTSQP